MALEDWEHPGPAFLALEGMSGRRYRLFINALIRLVPNPRYLEVGVWAGSTLCSAIAGNKVQAVAIDNWSQFSGTRERLLENLKQFGAGSEVTVIERDFRELRFGDYGRFNVYLYDGPHSAADQHDGLAMALPALDSEFVLIVDDWNWAEVRTGTRSVIDQLELEVVFAIEVRTTADDTHPAHCGFEAKGTDWHNGYFIAVLRKPVESPRPGLRFRTALVSGWRHLSESVASKARASMERYASDPAMCEVLALITHHYVPERRQWLEEVLQGLADLGARRTHALILTNAADSDSITNIRNLALPHITANFSAEVLTAPPLVHPNHLPWAQKPLIVERFLRNGSAFTHIVSLEDDVAFGREAFAYWLQYRPLLAAHGLIPSFMRTEMRPGDPVIYATDTTAVNFMGSRQSVRVGGFTFVALDNPYCAVFVLDRVLAREYAASKSFHMDASKSISSWGTLERASMGLCWERPPRGFPARWVVPVDEATMSVAPCCHVRHLPGNYANNPASPHGKLPVDAVLKKGTLQSRVRSFGWLAVDLARERVRSCLRCARVLVPSPVKRRVKAMLARASENESNERERLKQMPRYVAGQTQLFGRTIEFVDACTYLLMYNDLFERQLYRFETASVHPLIIDGGANIGLSSIYFKRLYPKSKLIAFEPDPVIFEVLRRNCSAFGLTEVELVAKALWSSETVLSFEPEGSCAGRIYQGRQVDAGRAVKTCRLRDYLQRPVALLKLDIEGAETEVLRDCADLLINAEHIFVEHHSFLDRPQDLHIVINLLQQAGFRLFIEAAAPAPQPLVQRTIICGMDVQLNIFGFRA